MKQKIIFALFIILAAFTACSDDDDEVMQNPIISGIEDSYTLLSGEELELKPTIENSNGATFLWTLSGKEVAKTPTYLFAETEPGEYEIELKVINGNVSAKATTTILVGEKNFTFKGETNTVIALTLPDYARKSRNISWEMIETPSVLYGFSENTVGSDLPLFIAAKSGKYLLQLTAEDVTGVMTIIVTEREQPASAYIANVFDYNPAPGQFVNTMPEYVPGDTYEDMLAKVATNIVGEEGELITLGGWGGSVTFGFDHTIVNVVNKQDFRVEGNAFSNSSEPGIIMVSYDANGNGKPDDEWYEIKGSANFTAENEEWFKRAETAGNDVATHCDYEMSYYKPDIDTPTAIEEYIRWENNKGKKGFKRKNTFHKQSYYPLWIDADKLTFSGIRLAENSIDKNGDGSYFVRETFQYGYADNHLKMDYGSTFNIDWAVDKEGNKANLPGIDFVKVYTGVDQENGELGEVSTEVERAIDLHLNDEDIDSKEY